MRNTRRPTQQTRLARSFGGRSGMVSEELDRARLLTVDGYGHTVLLNPSSCASALENKYLVDGTLPRHGTVCKQNARPFGVRSAP